MSGLAYEPCPCGSGEKTKFCCSKDITHELTKVVEAYSAEQRVSALGQINRLLETKGRRNALLALKATLHFDMEDYENLSKTTEHFLAQAPTNSTALAYSSIVELTKGNVDLAVERFHRAFMHSQDHIPIAVYSALSLVAEALLRADRIIAARAHFLLLSILSGGNDENAEEVLAQIAISRNVPLLFKETPNYWECPADAPWKARFDEAMELTHLAKWLAAWEAFLRLANEVPDSPAVLRNLAVLQNNLGDVDGAAQSWHRFAQLPGVSLDDAVQAEALAQLLAPNRATVDFLRLAFAITDANAVQEKMLSDRRFNVLPEPEATAEGEPPPKAKFLLLDRPMPMSVDGLTYEAAPRLLGEMVLYGKQTDRDARLELLVTRSAAETKAKQILGEVLGTLTTVAEEKLGEISSLTELFGNGVVLPHDMPLAQRKAISQEHRRHCCLVSLLDLPFNSLDGKTPRQASADPQYHIPLLAEILQLELSLDSDEIDFNELRRTLGLPAQDEITVDENEIRSLPLVRLPRVNVAAFPDRVLTHGLAVAAGNVVRRAVRNFAREILRRPSLQAEREFAHAVLAQSTSDGDEAIAELVNAQKAAMEAGRSPARHMLAELPIHAQRGNVEELQRILSRLETKHINEPGIREGVQQFFISIGAMTPDGRPTAAARPREPAAPTPPAAAPSGLWTPGAPTAESAPKKLWVPGA